MSILTVQIFRNPGISAAVSEEWFAYLSGGEVEGKSREINFFRKSDFLVSNGTIYPRKNPPSTENI